MTKHALPELSMEEMRQRATGFFLMDMAAVFIYLEKKGMDPADLLNFELENWPQRKYDSPVQFLIHVMTAYYALGTPRENFRIIEVSDNEVKGMIKDCVVKKILDAKPRVTGEKRDFAPSAQMLGEAKIHFSSDPFCKNLCIYYMNGEAKTTGFECIVKKGYGSDSCQLYVRKKV